MTSEIKVLTFAEGTPVNPPVMGPPVNVINKKIRSVEQIDSTTTGTNQTTVTNTSSIMKMTNAGLVSISGIAGWATGQFLVWMNDTGVPVTVINNSAGVVTDGILTGTGSNISVAAGSALFMSRFDSLNRWIVIGGTGGGAGGIARWVTAKAYLIDNVIIQGTKIYVCLADHTSGTFATDLAGGKWQALSDDLTQMSGVLPIINGGTGSSSQNFVDLTTVQSIAGVKTFSATTVFVIGSKYRDGQVTPKYATVKAPAVVTADYDFVLPITAGTNGQVLSSTGTGTLWITPFSYTAPKLFQSLIWYKGDSGAAPYTTWERGLRIENFDVTGNPSMFSVFTVPSDYVAGTQIFLRKSYFKTGDTTGKKVSFKAISSLIKPTAVYDPSIGPTLNRTSANTEVTASGTAYTLNAVGDMDVTDAAGLIAGNAVAAGDRIMIELYRGFASVDLVADVQLLADGMEIKY